MIVKLKEGVLDPQGQTIQKALAKLGHSKVRSVRQGKCFELEFEDGSDADEVRAMTEEIARKVLSNPIIEVFEVEEDS
ncbi:MAG TPA: phosphoribosylformylglycinamidine synthase subunit PurS [Acidobacteriota bacterium]|nr:phosphoribosylformylglycinamidine synthase subunit PurS [Acidobacteriota bacterium]